jgi:YD repeat-containing protein
MLKKILTIITLFITITLHATPGATGGAIDVTSLHDIVYEYDKLNRVTKAIYASGESISYRYDAGGNLLEVVFKGKALPTVSSNVLATGQTKSYIDYDDGYYQIGIKRSFTRVGNIVKDDITGLIWQDNKEVETNEMYPYDAQQYCNNLTLGGYNDWRLPEITELYTLLYNGSFLDVFNYQISSYLSNTKHINHSGYWSLTTLTSVAYGPGSKYNFRCVRGENKLKSKKFVKVENKDIVIDIASKLMWQDNREANTTKLTWKEAINYCENLELGGYKNWRLPNINELLTLTDYKDKNIFKNTFKYVPIEGEDSYSGTLWSSTRVAYNNGARDYNEAYGLYFKIYMGGSLAGFNVEPTTWERNPIRNIRCVHSLPKDFVTNTDTDNDGITDEIETKLGLNPNSIDSDGDGISDLEEVGNINNPIDTDKDGTIDALDSDSDNDGISDEDEVKYGLNPKDSSDANKDSDGDGVSNIDEIKAGTDPNDKNDVINNIPEINFGKDRVVAIGEEINIPIYFNTKLKKYPALIELKTNNPFNVKYELNMTNLTINSGLEGNFSVKIAKNNVCSDFKDEYIEFGFKNLIGIKAGKKDTVRLFVTCTKELKVQIAIKMDGKRVSIVNNTSKPVILEAVVNQDNVIYDWSNSSAELLDFASNTYTSKRLILNLESIQDGSYDIVLNVKNNQNNTLTLKRKLIVKRDNNINNIDSDGDGINDIYDDIAQQNMLQTKKNNSNKYVMQVRSGEKIELGDMALEELSQQASIPIEKLPKIEGYKFDEIFDFRITNLDKGDSTYVVIPLTKPILKGAKYFKYDKNNGWREFKINAKNKVYSAQRVSEGVCPPVNDSSYKEGLIEGYYCIELELEDGGPNDTDGLINSEISDPSGVGIKEEKSKSTPNKSSTKTKSSGGGGFGFVLPLIALILFASRGKIVK